MPDTAKRALLEEIDAELRETAYATGRDRLSPRVRRAFERVPREAFVPEAYASSAYDNTPLPIGGGQTISQPFIVALMTELLDLAPDARVLEIGTGSGYQTALLAELAAAVFTVERLADLSERARATLQGLGYGNIQFRIGDGHAGWPEAAPFDAIIVTAAAARTPRALQSQLALGGRLLLPVGPAAFRKKLRGKIQLGEERRPFSLIQQLTLVRRVSAKRFTRTHLLEVAFVPLIEDPARAPD